MNNLNQEDIDVLKHISKTHRELMDQRRKYEWKAIYAFMTFLVLVVFAKYKHGVNADPCILTIALVILMVIAFLFLIAVHKANGHNKAIAKEAEDWLIDDLLAPQANPAGQQVNHFQNYNQYRPFLGKYWALGIEIALMVLFTLVPIFLILEL